MHKSIHIPGRATSVLAITVLTCLALSGSGCSKQNPMSTSPMSSQSQALGARHGSPPSDLPVLASASSFAVLGGSTVTNTGLTVVTGDLGVSPGTAVTGFGPGTLTGTLHAGDPVAAQAQADLTTAYNAMAGLACGTSLTGQDLGGMTLAPGVYCFSSSAQLTGTLVLDAQGNPDAVFVFQIGSTITTGTNSAVVLINGGRECNVFWQVGSSATLGVGTRFIGNILANASITVTTGVTLSGRALARVGAVTMDTDTVTVGNCTGGVVGGCSVKVTGGGSIAVEDGFATFGFEVMQRKDGGIHGTLQYVDHSHRADLHLDQFSSLVISGHTATFVGTGKKNGVPGTFTVVVTDLGSPGRGDSFSIASPGRPTASGVLRSGNITIHKKHCGGDNGDDDGDDDGDGHGHGHDDGKGDDDGGHDGHGDDGRQPGSR